MFKWYVCGVKVLYNNILTKIVILYRDRLLIFGYELLEGLFARFGTTIEVVDNTEKTENVELVEGSKFDDFNKENQTKTN